MYDPVRRNRNIGTTKQGHGQDNELSIPQPAITLRSFYERLTAYTKTERKINGHDFLFVTEGTRATSRHACTVDDIAKIIGHIPQEDYGDLRLIVLRQPKRKEETLQPVWGRLIYSYEFEGKYMPAIIVEAIDFTNKFKWSRSLQPEAQRELERLRADGHRIVEEKRNYVATYELENVRNTQLYRTIPHEFGHYVHYLNLVELPGHEDEDYEVWQQRSDAYFNLNSLDKEAFAHRYADKLRSRLVELGVIPFGRIGR